MKEEKIFCGNGKIIKTTFGEIPKISMSKNDINTIVKYMKDNNLEWINLEMLKKQSPEQGKPTHYLKIDTWKPDKSKSSSNDDSKDLGSTNDLPF